MSTVSILTYKTWVDLFLFKTRHFRRLIMIRRRNLYLTLKKSRVRDPPGSLEYPLRLGDFFSQPHIGVGVGVWRFPSKILCYGVQPYPPVYNAIKQQRCDHQKSLRSVLPGHLSTHQLHPAYLVVCDHFSLSMLRNNGTPSFEHRNLILKSVG